LSGKALGSLLISAFFALPLIVETVDMNQKLKAIILSALVFPGSGQFLIKRPVLGGIFAGLALISFSIILMAMVERSLLIAEKIQLGEIPLDIEMITGLLLQQQTAGSSSYIVNIAWVMLLLAWLISIIHLSLVKPE